MSCIVCIVGWYCQLFGVDCLLQRARPAYRELGPQMPQAVASRAFSIVAMLATPNVGACRISWYERPTFSSMASTRAVDLQFTSLSGSSVCLRCFVVVLTHARREGVEEIICLADTCRRIKCISICDSSHYYIFLIRQIR